MAGGPGLGNLAVESEFASAVGWLHLQGRARGLPVLGGGALQSSAGGKSPGKARAQLEL